MREAPQPVKVRQFGEAAAREDRRRPLQVEPLHVRLEVQVDPRNPVVKGQVTHRVRGLVEGITRVALDAEEMEIHAARQGGEAVAFHLFDGGVELALRPLGLDALCELELDFTARPSLGLFFVDGDRPQAWTQGAMEDHHHWFPCFDAPEHMVTSEVIAIVPEGLRAVSNGVPLVEDEPVEGGRRFHWRHDSRHALYLLSLVVDDSVCVVDERGPVPLYTYVPAGREGDAELIFDRVPQMMEYFAEATGLPYPYPRYGHVFLQNFVWGGMENTTLTSLTDAALIEGRHLEEENLERLIAHELAHQWFGDLIAPRGWPELWLNESFATYFEQLCMAALDGPDDFARRMMGERDSYLGEARGRYARPIVTRNYVHPYVLFDRHAYEKGCLVLHTLRDQIGDAAWWQGLRAYVAACKGSAAETPQLRRCFEAACGLDLSEFFDHFVTGSGHPKVRVDWRYDPRGGVEVDLKRTDDGPHVVYCELLVCAEGELHRRRVRVAPGERTIVVDAPRPLWVALDPEQRCLIEVDESAASQTALHARLLAPAPRELRMRTARVLGKRGTPASTRVLARCLAEDPSEAVRIEVAAALGKHRSDAARYALLGAFATPDPSWRVRRAAGKALGVGAPESLVERFEDLLGAEPSHRARCGLLRGLGQIKHAEARAALFGYLDLESPRHCVAAAAVSALAAQEDAEVVDELEIRARAGHPRQVRTAAIGGMARVARAEGIEAAVKRRVRKALEGYLSDPNYHVRGSAVAGLARIASKRSKGALERAHGGELYALLRRKMREALGKLK